MHTNSFIPFEESLSLGAEVGWGADSLTVWVGSWNASLSDSSHMNKRVRAEEEAAKLTVSFIRVQPDHMLHRYPQLTFQSDSTSQLSLRKSHRPPPPPPHYFLSNDRCHIVSAAQECHLRPAPKGI